MNWQEDSYVILAGDVSASFAGRAFNMERNRWETTSGVGMSRSIWTPRRLKSAAMRIFTTAGVGRRGILSHMYTIGDPTQTDRRLLLHGAQLLLKGDDYIHWGGDMALGAGFEWHLSIGAVIAGDRVNCQIGYE